MELSVVGSSGLPERHGVLSVKLGNLRRQGPLPCEESFKFTSWPCSAQIDVFRRIGRGDTSLPLRDALDSDRYCKVPLRSISGQTMSMTFRVQTGCPYSEKEEAEEKACCWDYLDDHGVKAFLRDVFILIMTEQPEDPYAYLASCLKVAADAEAGEFGGVPGAALPGAKLALGKKVLGQGFKGRTVAKSVAPVRSRNLKSRAAHSLATAIRDGKLENSLKELPQTRALQHTGSHTKFLRTRGRSLLTASLRRGRLSPALSETPQLTSLSSPSASTHPGSASMRNRARELLTNAQQNDELLRVLQDVSLDGGFVVGDSKQNVSVETQVQKSVAPPSRARVLRARARHLFASAGREGRLSAALSATPQLTTLSSTLVSMHHGNSSSRYRARTLLNDARQSGTLLKGLQKLSLDDGFQAADSVLDNTGEAIVQKSVRQGRVTVDDASKVVSSGEEKHVVRDNNQLTTSKSIAKDERDMEMLRQRGAHALSQAYNDGRLTTFLTRTTSAVHSASGSEVRDNNQFTTTKPIADDDSDMGMLRQRGAHALSQAYNDGRLTTFLTRSTSAVHSASGSAVNNVADSDMESLRKRGADALSQAYLDGRLSAFLTRSASRARSTAGSEAPGSLANDAGSKTRIMQTSPGRVTFDQSVSTPLVAESEMEALRKRGADVLSKAHLDGRLNAFLTRFTGRTAAGSEATDSLTNDAVSKTRTMQTLPGRAPLDQSASTPLVAESEMEILRQRGATALSQAHLDGRLSAFLARSTSNARSVAGSEAARASYHSTSSARPDIGFEAAKLASATILNAVRDHRTSANGLPSFTFAPVHSEISTPIMTPRLSQFTPQSVKVNSLRDFSGAHVTSDVRQLMPAGHYHKGGSSPGAGEDGSTASTMTPRLRQFMPDYPPHRMENGHASSAASDASAGPRSVGAASPLSLSAHAEPVRMSSGGFKESGVAGGAVHEFQQFMPFAWAASHHRDVQFTASGVPANQERTAPNPSQHYSYVTGTVTPRLTQFIPDVRHGRVGE